MPISLINVSFSYNDDPLIVGVREEMPDGSLWIVTGDNGSGKTTLGRLICGLVEPDQGAVIINGFDVAQQRGRQRVQLAAFVPQRTPTYFLFDRVDKELSYAGKLRSLESRLERNDFRRALEPFGLAGALMRNPGDLSINEAWRLALALGLIASPHVLFIDEIPGLSSDLSLAAIEHVINARSSAGRITVIAVHRQTKLDALADGEIKL